MSAARCPSMLGLLALLTSVSYFAGSAYPPLFATGHFLLARCKPLTARAEEGALPREAFPQSCPCTCRAARWPKSSSGVPGARAPSLHALQRFWQGGGCTHLAHPCVQCLLHCLAPTQVRGAFHNSNPMPMGCGNFSKNLPVLPTNLGVSCLQKPFLF